MFAQRGASALYIGRSWFSLHEGTLPVETVVAHAARQGLRAVILADRGALYGAPAFVRACRAAGIKPIIGCTLSAGGEPFIAVATSPEGYRSLCRLVTGVRTESPPPPLAEMEAPGVVVLLTHAGQAELMPRGCRCYAMVEPWSREPDGTGLPLVAVDTGDVPLTPAALSEAFAYCPEALATAAELEQACADAFPAPSPRLPQVPGDIRNLARQGLTRRYGPGAPFDRLERELAVIEARGQSGYFLALWDLVQYAKEHSIPVGPGRGSAVGSITAYALGITSVDPVAHGLYFERFLNPERPDLPDIDLDVCSLGRPRLVAYLRDRYGHDRVAMAGVLATLGPRGAVREAGRMLGTPKAVVDAVAGALPQDGSIRDAVNALPEFRYLHVDREPIRSLLEAAEALQGRPWNTSVHAAGLVISPEPLADLVPLERTGGGEIVTQYNSQELEALGLVKIDILGLRNLTVIAQTCTAAGITPESIPTDDAATFAALAAGETLGVFQLDSPGIRRLLRQVEPRTVDDLIMVLSLYRPGPSQAGAVEAFCAHRQGLEPVRYLHPALVPILGETFGLIVYQEQIMRLAHEVAGLPLAAADQFRRAVAAGDGARYMAPFVSGAVARGIAPGIAHQIFGLLQRASGYSFNKAHTAAYAQISYTTAYLKVHHPAHYFAALLTYETGYFRPDIYLQEAQRLGVAVLPPHINHSRAIWAAETATAIRAGLLQMKGLGAKTSEAILAARAPGPFASLADFTARVPAHTVSARLLDTLVAGGLFAGLPTVGRLAPRPGQGARPSAAQLTFFDLGLESHKPLPARRPIAPAEAPAIDHLPEGSRVQVAGPVITCQRRPVRGIQVGLNMLLQVGAEQVSVLVPPEVYARDLLAIDPAGVSVEGRVERQRSGPRILASAIRPAV